MKLLSADDIKEVKALIQPNQKSIQLAVHGSKVDSSILCGIVNRIFGNLAAEDSSEEITLLQKKLLTTQQPKEIKDVIQRLLPKVPKHQIMFISEKVRLYQLFMLTCHCFEWVMLFLCSGSYRASSRRWSTESPSSGCKSTRTSSSPSRASAFSSSSTPARATCCRRSTPSRRTLRTSWASSCAGNLSRWTCWWRWAVLTAVWRRAMWGSLLASASRRSSSRTVWTAHCTGWQDRSNMHSDSMWPVLFAEIHPPSDTIALAAAYMFNRKEYQYFASFDQSKNDYVKVTLKYALVKFTWSRTERAILFQLCSLLSSVCSQFPQISSSSNPQQLVASRNAARNLWEHLLQHVFYCGAAQTKRSSSGNSSSITRELGSLSVAALISFIQKLKVGLPFLHVHVHVSFPEIQQLIAHKALERFIVIILLVATLNCVSVFRDPVVCCTAWAPACGTPC